MTTTDRSGLDAPPAEGDSPAQLFVPPADPANVEPVDLLGEERANGARIRLLGYPADRVAAEWRDDLQMECTTYYDAYAMPIASADDSTRQLIGALYATDGTLIAESQRAKTNLTWSDNPERLRRKPGLRTERLEGRTYFAGHYRSIFGHMLLEILPRFWPDLDYAAYDTLLFHPQRAGRRASHLLLEPYGDDLLAAATDGSQADLRIVAGRPLRLAEVTVATPGVWLKDGFSPAARIAFDKVADRLIGAGGPIDASRPTKLYLSRSRLSARHRRAENEAEVEDLMTSAGFTVVHPQTLPVREQVALVRSADVLAGCDGSALHLAVFARPGTRVVAFDSRPVPNQFLIEHLAGIDAVHVLAGADRAIHGRSDGWRASLPLVRAALAVASVD